MDKIPQKIEPKSKEEIVVSIDSNSMQQLHLLIW